MENFDFDNQIENVIDEIIEVRIFTSNYVKSRNFRLIIIYLAVISQDWIINDTSSDESESSDTESSDEDIQIPPHKRTCVKHFVEDTVNLYTDAEFKSHFRLSRQTTYNLIGNLIKIFHFIST